MDVVFSPERVLAPYHTLHKLNPVKTVGKRHLQLDDAGRNFELVPDLRPGAGPGVPPVAHSPSLTTLPSKRDQVAAHHQAAAALRHKRRNSTSAGAMQWPVPSLNSRDGHHVTLRGWIMSASPVVRHHNNQAKLEKNLKKYPRTYCAVFRSSILFLFDSVEDFRDFFKVPPTHPPTQPTQGTLSPDAHTRTRGTPVAARTPAQQHSQRVHRPGDSGRCTRAQARVVREEVRGG